MSKRCRPHSYPLPPDGQIHPGDAYIDCPESFRRGTIAGISIHSSSWAPWIWTESTVHVHSAMEDAQKRDRGLPQDSGDVCHRRVYKHWAHNWWLLKANVCLRLEMSDESSSLTSQLVCDCHPLVQSELKCQHISTTIHTDLSSTISTIFSFIVIFSSTAFSTIIFTSRIFSIRSHSVVSTIIWFWSSHCRKASMKMYAMPDTQTKMWWCSTLCTMSVQRSSVLLWERLVRSNWWMNGMN